MKLIKKIIYKIQYWFEWLTCCPAIHFQYNNLKPDDVRIKVNSTDVIDNSITVDPYEKSLIEISVDSNFLIASIALYEEGTCLGYVYVDKIYQLVSPIEIRDVYVIEHFIFRTDITLVLTITNKGVTKNGNKSN